jgi:hypothetical protein
MEYVALVFGILGMMGYLESASLKKRVKALEDQLAGIEGTAAFEDRLSLLAVIREYMGKKVQINFKEECEDPDVVLYGNSRHGSNTILDADEDWILVRVESPKGTKEKLVRMSSVKSVALAEQ